MIAAQLVGEAGGLQELARMPACNIKVLGKEKKSLAGYGRGAGSCAWWWLSGPSCWEPTTNAYIHGHHGASVRK